MAERSRKVKYVLELCEAGYNSGKILSRSIHDTFDEAMDAIPFKMEFDDASSRADIKNTLDSVGSWSICGIGNLSYVIHTRK